LTSSILREHKEQCYARRELRNESLKVLITCVDMGLVKTLPAIAILTEHNALPDSEKVQRIRTLLMSSIRSIPTSLARKPWR
jgi:hypothetical protein